VPDAMRVIYIHGFNSSPQSYKAQQFGQWLRLNTPEIDYQVPKLSPYPTEAIAQLQQLIDDSAGQRLGLVGSSLGGYYATWLAQYYGIRAVLVNPSVRPFELLRDYLGTNTNIYTGERYELQARHFDDFRQLYVETFPRPELFWLMVQTQDETLDFKEATARYWRSANLIEYGGDHSFMHFERWFDAVVRFLFSERAREEVR